ncbi:abortive infection bacteriophage resistance protein [Microbacterium phyllosphaerae]|uniref:Abortive infection bacteriophage resistance protein n=1 Tax=Microbacterium phyllosphaerae TaxID=124798 RepID=A0ABS4WU97_9MICO|nr:Abi family protein [Microbacterium phyllosphaerae]MBP2379770.1 abortive infection bacteriophage resistance protein [Microbacterium phyllosphaerae]
MKPHLPYDEQLAKMLGRGLTSEGRPAAIAALKRIGYYRLSAYTYPFREPPTEADVEIKRTRSERFRAGARLEDALHLYEFDRKLRAVLLQALQEIEVGFATKVGYTLGKRAGDGHLKMEHLDQSACCRVTRDGVTEHAAWVQRYEKLRKDAMDEEYVKHHILHYDGEIPIWVSTGFMDFGCLIRLYSLMDGRDRKKIAYELGLKGNGSDTLHRWLRALNILRNNCAHSNRIWNRATVDVPPKFSPQVAAGQLHHLNDLENHQRQKIYLLIALTAHLQRAVNPTSTWAWSTLVTQAKKLGNVGGMTLENTMGFPVGWQDLELWKKPEGQP